MSALPLLYEDESCENKSGENTRTIRSEWVLAEIMNEIEKG